MGLFDEDDEELLEWLDEEPKYPSCVAELNIYIVRSIFDKCLPKPESREIVASTLFPTTLGYERGLEKLIHFDKEKLLENKKNIEYLFGQLLNVHKNIKTMSLDDYNTTYQGEYWSADKSTLLKLLYLGAVPEILAIAPFNAKTNTSAISPRIQPTVSFKDPGFETWWEEHKAQWE